MGPEPGSKVIPYSRPLTGGKLVDYVKMSSYPAKTVLISSGTGSRNLFLDVFVLSRDPTKRKTPIKNMHINLVQHTITVS